MKKITFLISLMCASLSFGQALQIDFEDGTTVPSFNFGANFGTGNIVNPDQTAPNTSTRVLEANKPDNAEWSAGFGFETPGNPLIDLSLGTEFTFKVWAPVAGQTIRFQIQNSLNGAPTYVVDTVIPNAMVWTEVTVDFATQTNGTEQYAVFVMQPNYDIGCEGGGCTTVGTGNGGLWYIDDIVQTFDSNQDASLSDLTLDGTTIAGFSPSVTTYNAQLPNGTATAPTVAAVAAQAGNGSSNVSVTQAGGVPGTATVDVTAPDGVAMQTYTVNFTELPPAAPVPTEPAGAVVSILSNNTAYSDRGIPFFEAFGSTTAFYDLDASGADDAVSFQFGNGGQVNYFGNTPFVDVSNAGIFHIDFYCENLDAGDNFRVVLLPQNTGVNMEYRVTVDETQPGVWQSFEIGLAGAGSGLPDEFTGSATASDLVDLALIQIFPAEAGSTLGSEQVIVSNIYFSGGTLSTSEFDLASKVKIFPNPTNNVWNVKTNNQNITSIAVFDLLGKEVARLAPNATEANIDASGLTDGIYLAKISSKNGTRTIKLVKN